MPPTLVRRNRVWGLQFRVCHLGEQEQGVRKPGRQIYAQLDVVEDEGQKLERGRARVLQRAKVVLEARLSHPSS